MCLCEVEEKENMTNVATPTRFGSVIPVKNITVNGRKAPFTDQAADREPTDPAIVTAHVRMIVANHLAEMLNNSQKMYSGPSKKWTELSGRKIQTIIEQFKAHFPDYQGPSSDGEPVVSLISEDDQTYLLTGQDAKDREAGQRVILEEKADSLYPAILSKQEEHALQDLDTPIVERASQGNKALAVAVSLPKQYKNNYYSNWYRFNRVCITDKPYKTG
jgi:hypothetical protein